MAEDITHEITSHLSGHALTQKMGPLPVWGWGVLLGGGMVVYLYMHHSSSRAASAPPPDSGSSVAVDPATALPEVSGTPLGSGAGDGGGGYGPYDPYTPPTDPGTDAGGIPPTFNVTIATPQKDTNAHPHIMAARHARTNKHWAQAIHAALLAHGIRPYVANHALHNYLTGKHLTAPQYDAISQARAWAAPPRPHEIPHVQVHTQTEPHGGTHPRPVHHPQQRPHVHRRG